MCYVWVLHISAGSSADKRGFIISMSPLDPQGICPRSYLQLSLFDPAGFHASPRPLVNLSVLLYSQEVSYRINQNGACFDWLKCLSNKSTKQYLIHCELRGQFTHNGIKNKHVYFPPTTEFVTHRLSMFFWNNNPVAKYNQHSMWWTVSGRNCSLSIWLCRMISGCMHAKSAAESKAGTNTEMVFALQYFGD